MALATALLLGCPKPAPVAEETPTVTLDELTDGQEIAGFTTRAVYLDDAGKVFGAQFVHGHTGFVLDYVQIPSVDQGYVWVNTVPTSDRGEPHTQEHLLLGKGNKGRSVASRSSMSLVESSAFTEQVRTVYHFHTLGSPDGFFDAFEFQVDGLLHPDYTDEEIRREVHHYGVAEGPDGLSLEEKGTVYNEMVSSYDRPGHRVWTAMANAEWGKGHPYALSSGGLPDAIREMEPEHIRSFHAANYQLGNMGMIGAFGPDLPLGVLLSELDGRLHVLQPEATPADAQFVTEDDLPAATPVAPGTVTIVPYPSADTSRPGDVIVAWPPARDLSLDDTVLLRSFLHAYAGSEASPLYKRLVDTTTRKVDVGGTNVWAYAWDRRGTPVLVGLDGLPAERLDEATAATVRAEVRAQLAEIAAWPAGSPELVAFEELLRGGVAVSRRGYRQMISSPPRWGFRGAGSEWFDLLLLLDQAGGFRRSMTLSPSYDHVEAVLDREDNPWGEYLAAWGLLDTEPVALVSKADAALLESQNAERAARIAAEVTRLQGQYRTADAQDALASFKFDYDAETARMEAVAASDPMPKFVDDPPLTLDDALDSEAGTVTGTQIPLFAGHFATMTGATTTLALSLQGVPAEDWIYLPILPALMGETGAVVDGEVIPNDVVVRRLQEEILGLGFSTDADYDTDRHELVVAGTGTTPEESARALVWMRRLLVNADWREENLPRIRDVVDEQLVGLQGATQGPEEYWVQDPARAWRNQDAGAILATESFLTSTHAVRRIRWRLADPPSAGFQSWLKSLRDGGGDRAAIEARLADVVARHKGLTKLAAPERELGARLAGDLAQAITGVPDATLAADWKALCDQASADLAMPPADVLADLRDLRASLLLASRARVVVASAPDTLAGLDLAGLVADLDPTAPLPSAVDAPAAPFAARLKARGVDGTPLFVGLVMPDLRGGVFVLTVPSPSIEDTDREALLDVLTGNTYTGHGAHSLFMKTWGAGLAYSNGVRPDTQRGRLLYYAERCPELPQTLGFVIDTLKAAKVDDGIAQYAISQGFNSRAGDAFESRTTAMARDLVDGRTPDKVRAFREALLALRDDPELATSLEGRLERVYGEVLPGWGPPSKDVPGGSFIVLGDERQIAAWEAWLAANEPDGGPLVRIYPSDFWLP